MRRKAIGSVASAAPGGWVRLGDDLRGFAVMLAPLGLAVYPLGGAAAVILALLLSRSRRRWLWWIPVVAFVLVAGLVAALSDWPATALLDALATVVLLAALILFYTRLSQRDLLWLGVGLSLTAIAIAGRAAQQVYVLGQRQAVGFTHHANVGGSLALLVVVGLLGSFSCCKRWAYRLWLWLGLLAAVAAVVLSGSRAVYLGFVAAAAVMLLLIMVQRRSWLLLGLLGVLTAAGVGLYWWGEGRAAASISANLLVNSDFSQGWLRWQQGPDTSLVTSALHGHQAVQLATAQSGLRMLLSTSRLIRATEGVSYTLSAYVQPAPAALERAFFRVEAFDAERQFIARAGLEGWTSSHENQAGGRIFLPIEPVGSWERLAVALAPAPPETHFLRVSVMHDGAAGGVYGFMDGVQLEAGSAATAYQAGPPPHPLDYLGPLVPRLEQLLNPGRSSGGRIFMAMLGLELAAARPLLGYGFGAWQQLIPAVEPALSVTTYGHSHNLYVELLLDGGSLLLVAVLMFFTALGWALLRRAWVGSWVAAASFAALVGFAVSNLFDVLAYQPYVTGLFLIVLVQGLIAGEGVA